MVPRQVIAWFWPNLRSIKELAESSLDEVLHDPPTFLNAKLSGVNTLKYCPLASLYTRLSLLPT